MEPTYSKRSKEGLKKAGFVASKVDECVFYKGKTVFIVYVDDGIFFGPDLKEIEQAMKNLDAQGFNLDMMGDVNDYLGINFERLPDGRVKMSQPQLIEQILKDVGLIPGANTKSTPLPPVDISKRLTRGPVKREISLPVGSRKVELPRQGDSPRHSIRYAPM
jgi:hypothetical protein